MKQISVIIPTFNRKKELALLLDSLVKQSLDRNLFEVIVIDDGSNDGTDQVVKKFQKDNNFIYQWIHNQGRSVARNKGASIAKAIYLSFIDSDCIPNNTWLEEIHSIIINNPEMLVIRGPIISSLPNLPPFIHSCIIGKDYYTGVFSIRATFFKDLAGFDELLSYYAEDTEIWARIVKSTDKIYFSEKIIVAHPPYYKGYSFLKNHTAISFWKLNRYLGSKHPELNKWHHKDIILATTIKVLLKTIFIISMLLIPVNISLLIRILSVILFFNLYGLLRIARIYHVLCKTKSTIKISFWDGMQFVLLNWLTDFINLFILIYALLLDKNPPSPK